jgi:hypothetical protein
MLTVSNLQLLRPANRYPSDIDGAAPGIVHPEADRFHWQLDSLLRRLGDLRLRISMARLSVGHAGAPEFWASRNIADNILDPCAMVGVMPDYCIVAAFLGPRFDAGSGGDREMTRRIRGRFLQALAAGGQPHGASMYRLAIVHGWTDQIRDLPAMTHELRAATPIQIEAVRPA